MKCGIARSHDFTSTSPRDSRSGYATSSRRRVVGHVVERERRIAVGAERAVRVERHAPRPAEHSDVEVEDAPRVAARDEDREERDDGQHEKRQPQEREHDVVGNREDPLDEPEPTAETRVELALDADGIRLLGIHACSSVARSSPYVNLARARRARSRAQLGEDPCRWRDPPGRVRHREQAPTTEPQRVTVPGAGIRRCRASAVDPLVLRRGCGPQSRSCRRGPRGRPGSPPCFEPTRYSASAASCGAVPSYPAS